MTTELLRVNSRTPEVAAVDRAAATIRAGGLVAFPTETVYGLGANALDPAAVARIFEAKGRPPSNPLIVHVAEAADVSRVAAHWPELAAKLAERFWPGPLTLVVPKRDGVPDIVTAGGPTVALRCPNHAVAQALIRAAGVPLAAPSANRSTELSATRAEHVWNSLAGRIDLILDGGPCLGGIESTVLDLSDNPPRVLRPGGITTPMLEAICGPLAAGPAPEAAGRIARSPGQMAKHYSPHTPLLLASSNNVARTMLAVLQQQELKCYWLAFGDEPGANMAMPTTPEPYAAELYNDLHQLDAAGLDRILVTLPPDRPEWAAIRDRLTRAATAES